MFTPWLKAERAFGNYEKRRLACLEVSISPRRLVLGNMAIPHTTRRVLPVFLAGLNRSGGFIAVVSLGGLLAARWRKAKTTTMFVAAAELEEAISHLNIIMF